jgi:hypothetical protein
MSSQGRTDTTRLVSSRRRVLTTSLHGIAVGAEGGRGLDEGEQVAHTLGNEHEVEARGRANQGRGSRE